MCVGVCATCCVLIPDSDGAVMGGCRDPSCAVRKRGEKHAAGRGLLVASVLHHLTARLPQVPQLRRQDQISQNILLQTGHLGTLTNTFFSYSQCVQLETSQTNVILVGVSLLCSCHDSGNNYSADSQIHSSELSRGNIHRNKADGLTVASQPWPPKPLLLDTK